jgi:histidinol-phosphate aminotransferase
MIPIRARANGLVPAPVPVRADGDLDAEAMLATGARIMYLCTPNNPTGIAHSRVAIERVIANAPGIVILDEAYAEFADEVHTAWASREPGVFVTRTLSKSFGLAGLRIGFGVGRPELIAEVEKARGPYRVNAFADRAATAALENDRAWMAALASEVRTVRTRFTAALHAMGLSPLPSQGNFVCVPVGDSRAAATRLHAHGIAVRPFAAVPGIGDVLRIGLAPWPVLERVGTALRAVLADA